MKRWILLLLVLALLACAFHSAFADNSFIGFAYVEKDSVNVREQPNGDRTHRLNSDEIVFVLEEKTESDGQVWYLVNFKPRNDINKTGWIRGDMLKLSRDIFTDVKKIAVGHNLIAALKKDGTVTAVGEQYPSGFNPDAIHWKNITDIAAGICTVLGVTAGGELVSNGSFIPIGYGDAPDAAKVYMCDSCSIVVRKDGTVFASPEVLGKRYLPQNKGVSALPDVSDDTLTRIDALSISGGKLLELFAAGQELGNWSIVNGVASGAMHRVLLMRDGTVRAFGEDYYGAGDVSGWADIVQVACAEFRTVGLKSDGTVVAVGYNGYGECDVSGWRNIVQVECDSRFTVGLTAGGQVLVAGAARFDYDHQHDELYKAKHEEMTSLISQARELDKGYN